MNKIIYSLFLIMISSICFGQTLVGKYEVKGFQYEVHTDFAENYPNQTKKEIYKISRVANESILQSVFIDKYLKNDVEEVSSEFQLLDGVFVFEKTQNSTGQKFYSVDRVFVGDNGKLYKHDEKYFSPNKSALNTYEAQFPGARRGLENWIMNHFRPYDFEPYAKEGESAVKFRINFTVDENGKISEIEISGNGGWKEKALEIMNKMPDWFPAMENGTPVKAKMNLPVHIVLDY